MANKNHPNGHRRDNRHTNLKNAVALRACLVCSLEPLSDLANRLIDHVLKANRTLGLAARELGIGRRTLERIVEDRDLAKRKAAG